MVGVKTKESALSVESESASTFMTEPAAGVRGSISKSSPQNRSPGNGQLPLSPPGWFNRPPPATPDVGSSRKSLPTPNVRPQTTPAFTFPGIGIDEDVTGLAQQARHLQMEVEPASGAGSAAPSRLCDEVPTWWHVPERVASTAEVFDTRHKSRAEMAQAALKSLGRDVTSQKHERRFEMRMLEIRSNRFQVQPLRMRWMDPGSVSPRRGPQPPSELRLHSIGDRSTGSGPWHALDLDPESGLPAHGEDREVRLACVPPPEVKKWVPEEDSFFRSRCETSDARAMLDTEEVAASLIRNDCQLLSGRLPKYVEEVEGGSSPEEEAEEPNPAIGAAHRLLRSHQREILQVFDHYSAAGSSRDEGGSKPAWSPRMQLGGFLDLVAETGIADEESKTCALSHAEELFIQINADRQMEAADDDAAAAEQLPRTGLDRHELMLALVRLAVMKYIVPGTGADPPHPGSALSKLLTECLLSATHAFHDPNSFRRRHCHVKAADEVLRKREVELRATYDRFGSEHDAAGRAQRLELGGWTRLLDDCSMLGEGSGEVPLREAQVMFARARMRSLADSPPSGSAEPSTTWAATFEDFCEATVRVAVAIRQVKADRVKLAPGAESEARRLDRLLALLTTVWKKKDALSPSRRRTVS